MRNDNTGVMRRALRSYALYVVGGGLTVLDTDRFNVANNEAFLTYLFEFLVGGSRTTETPTPTATATPTGNETATGG